MGCYALGIGKTTKYANKPVMCDGWWEISLNGAFVEKTNSATYVVGRLPTV